MRTLVWFRRDLRLRDNTALVEAARQSDAGVVGVFLLCPAQWKSHDEADCKVQFWLRNLRSLSDALHDRNIPLIVDTADRFHSASRVLRNIARRAKCDALFFNREYEVNERKRDEAVERAFRDEGLKVQSFTDHVILQPDVVRTQADGFFSVFTPYRKKWCKIVKDRGGVSVQRMPPRQKSIRIQRSSVPASVPGFDDTTVDPQLWPAGEDHALNRLRAFIDGRVDAYAEKRNFPALNGTSTLSPYLAAGVLSPRQCLSASLRANNNRLDSGKHGVVTWIQEIIWREFYQHILVGFPRVSMHRPFKPETDQLIWNKNPEALEAWKQGRTGYPIVDAAMRQLLTTGWMHNRLRMITAMFFCKDLFLDWRIGEQHFMRHLIDGDLGSNNGGWQWSASTGTDAAPYFRIFNPVTQSRRFDPHGAFIRRHCPELSDPELSDLDEKAIHTPTAPPKTGRSRAEHSGPIVDHETARKQAIAAFRSLRK